MTKESAGLRTGPKDSYHDKIFEEEINNMINITKEQYDLYAPLALTLLSLPYSLLAQDILQRRHEIRLLRATVGSRLVPRGDRGRRYARGPSAILDRRRSAARLAHRAALRRAHLARDPTTPNDDPARALADARAARGRHAHDRGGRVHARAGEERARRRADAAQEAREG